MRNFTLALEDGTTLEILATSAEDAMAQLLPDELANLMRIVVVEPVMA